MFNLRQNPQLRHLDLNELNFLIKLMIHQTQKLVFQILLCLFLLQSAALAVDLTQYRQKIQKVTESVGYLNYPEEYLSESQNIAQQKEILQDIRAKLPLTEKIELGGTTFEVNHGLILEKLKEFENESYNSTKRTPIINEVFDRLSALQNKVTELEQAELSKRTKDEEKQKLEEILRRPEYEKPKEKEETWIQRKWREFLEWLMKSAPQQKQKTTQEGSPMLSSTLLYIILAIALAFISFLIYRFAPFFIHKIRTREKRDKKSRVILGETISAEETSQNIFSEAENLARNGNLRGAIRKGYIALLCELSDRKIIGLARHKTNRDYLRDVKNKKELHQNMNVLTLNFERNWYGFNQADEKDWEEFKQTYQQTIK